MLPYRRAPADLSLALRREGGVEPGDLLLSLGKYYARDLDQVAALLEGVRSGEPIDLTLRREYRGELYQYETRVHAR